MSEEQQAVETAADNCEVLRARLAKYEDAQGVPVATIADQAQQIEKLILARDDYKKQAHDYRAKWAAAIASGDSPVGALEAIRAEFPILDDEGLDQEAHHCEWAIQQDRKRLNRLLDALSPSHGEQVLVPRELLEDLRDLASDAVEHHRQAFAGYKLERQAIMDDMVKQASALLNGGRE